MSVLALAIDSRKRNHTGSPRNGIYLRRIESVLVTYDIAPRAVDVITQPQVERQVWPHLPIILDVAGISVDTGVKRISGQHRALIHPTEQQGCDTVSRPLIIKGECTARLIQVQVSILPVSVVDSELDLVRADYLSEVVGQLVGFDGSLQALLAIGAGGAADGGEAVDGHRREKVRISACQTDFRNNVCIRASRDTQSLPAAKG